MNAVLIKEHLHMSIFKNQAVVFSREQKRTHRKLVTITISSLRWILKCPSWLFTKSLIRVLFVFSNSYTVCSLQFPVKIHLSF